jgi:hypothetical protein
LALLGEQVRQKVPEFEKLRKALKGRIVQDGYVGSFAEYARWLWRADICGEYGGARVFRDCDGAGHLL